MGSDPWYGRGMGSDPGPRGGWGQTPSQRGGAMEKDVVCGMQVDPAKAAATSEYNGKTYYFCAKACKTQFDANPTKYVK